MRLKDGPQWSVTQECSSGKGFPKVLSDPACCWSDNIDAEHLYRMCATKRAILKVGQSSDFQD